MSTNEWNAKDAENFSHAIPRRLSAEELMDGLTRHRRAPVFRMFRQIRKPNTCGPHVGKDGFLDLFGRPPANPPANANGAT